MNEDMLLTCPLEVQAEHWKQRDLIGVLEQSLVLAIGVYVEGRAPESLPGTPPAADAPAMDWLDYFISQGSLVFHQEPELQEAAA